MANQLSAGAEERIATNIRKGVLEYCVLALLSRRDMYGLELANDLMARGLSASEGSLYPLLARMREAGSVETRWESAEASGASRPRRYYAITPVGTQALALFAGVWRSLTPKVDELLGSDDTLSDSSELQSSTQNTAKDES